MMAEGFWQLAEPFLSPRRRRGIRLGSQPQMECVAPQKCIQVLVPGLPECDLVYRAGLQDPLHTEALTAVRS